MFSRDKNINDINKIEKGIKTAFSRIKEEFDEHRLSINENTNEIQQNYQYLCELDQKIDTLSQRMDEICMGIGQLKNQNYKLSESRIIQPLTLAEQELFLVLYAKNKGLTYAKLAQFINKTEKQINDMIISMIDKGIPIIKRFDENKISVEIEDDFKVAQAKENILNIHESTMRTNLHRYS
jgi:DNA repair ATPase RecN